MHKSKLIPFLFFMFLSSVSFGQNWKGKPFTIGFYNVENLFDTIVDYKLVVNEEYSPLSEKVWDTKKYKTKLANLAKVISQLGDPDGPEVLGVCEVENYNVLHDLVSQPQLKKQGYKIVHLDSPDRRGIDVAMLYKPKYFQPYALKMIPVQMKNDPEFITRDVMMVSGIMEGETLHFFICHWPSRRGGLEASEPKRMAAAQAVRNEIEVLLKQDPKSKILVMGDFNDEPANNSLIKGLKAKGADFDPSKGELFNTMKAKDELNEGTYNYRGDWNMLDQLIISPALKNAEYGLDFVEGTASYQKEDWLLQDGTIDPQYKGYPLRTFGGKTYLAGYSDHLPVYLHLKKLK